jgi:hypothetical protein
MKAINNFSHLLKRNSITYLRITANDVHFAGHAGCANSIFGFALTNEVKNSSIAVLDQSKDAATVFDSADRCQ